MSDYIEILKKDNMIGENRKETIVALIIFGGLEFGTSGKHKTEVREWIKNSSFGLKTDEFATFDETWECFKKNGVFKNDMVYADFSDEIAGIEFALLVNVGLGYLKRITVSPQPKEER